MAVSRTASPDLAAKLTGYLPEPEHTQGKGKRITRSSIRSHARARQQHIAALKPLKLAAAQEITRKLPPEAFWQLSERHPLKKTHHRLTVPQDPLETSQETIHHLKEKKHLLPAVLEKFPPFRMQELIIPVFVPCPTTPFSCPFSPSHSMPPASPEAHSKPGSFSESDSESDIENIVASTAELHLPNYKGESKRHKHQRTIKKKKQADKQHALRIQRLLGLLSVAAFVDASLLQQVVRLIPSSSPEIVTEATLRSHPDVEQDSRMRLALRPEKKKGYYQIFAQEESRLQAEMLILLRQRDVKLAPLLFALQVLPVLPFLQAAGIQQEITTWLESFILRFTRTWFEQERSHKQENQLIRQAEQLFRLIEILPLKYRQQLNARSFLYAIVHKNTLQAGAVLSAEYDAETVIQTVRKAGPLTSYHVLQQGEKLFLYLSTEVATSQLPGSPLLQLELSVDCVLVHKQGRILTLPVRSGSLLHDCTGPEKKISLQTATEQLVLSTCFRPFWAQAMGRNNKGLFVDAFWLNKTCRLTWENCPDQGPGTWVGNDDLKTDQYGLLVDLKIKDVFQRFRRITPGWFMMGSPEDEPERESWGKEALHEVILNKNFWVADTAVTRELWQAITGDHRDSPGYSQGDNHPIVQVSYQDAVAFLEQLNEVIPEIKARLLTEAEWEYCCRAGTATPFFFGNRMSTEQVNYNGQHPYHGGLMGKNRKQTVAVKSLPCNSWGLFEMHGNVWEWCQDYWQDDLSSEEPQLNPIGPEHGEFRVVRGGSWLLGGRGVRSAVRGKFAPHFRSPHIGFRIALTPDEEPVTRRCN
jgi:formylglycine-generating enzyme required for sulfatase activity